MENYQSQWQHCLQLICQNVKDSWIFTSWAGLVFESYDPEQKVVMLQVPDTHVVDFLERYYTPLMAKALAQTFGPGIRLQYRLVRHEPSFADVSEYLRQHSAYDSRRDPYHIRIPDARRRMEACMHDLLGDRAQWLTAYDRVANWLTDNRGRGLLCVGAPSTGKSFFCQKMLPAILGNGGRPIPTIDATDLRARLDELKRERICIIDDLGKEPCKHYGEPDNSFFELCNNAERTGNLLIITTNLSPNIISPTHPDAARYPDSIEHRYGRAVLDRLKVITSAIEFRGNSLRAQRA